MANFLFENSSKTDEICIEIIKCPNPNDCDNEIGDGRYDTFIIPPDQSHQVNTKCDEICWKYSGEKKHRRTAQRVITV
jgi:hypothetical protein